MGSGSDRRPSGRTELIQWEMGSFVPRPRVALRITGSTTRRMGVGMKTRGFAVIMAFAMLLGALPGGALAVSEAVDI